MDLNGIEKKIRYVKDILKLIKFISNKYSTFSEMYRISFERPCRKSTTALYTIFSMENAGVTPINIGVFCHNRRILAEIIVRMDGQTN